METHKSRLDEILDSALRGFEEPFKEEEIVLVWDRKSFDEVGENRGNTTRFRDVPVNIHNHSLEEQVALILWGLRGQQQQQFLSHEEYLKIGGEALYRAWMLSGEQVASLGQGTHRMLTETLPVLISNAGFISITELLNEALSVELDGTAKSKVVSEVVKRGLVNPVKELYTLEGPQPFLSIGFRTKEHCPETVKSANVQRIKEFVRHYVPAEIEQSYVPLEQFLATVAIRLPAKEYKRQVTRGVLESRLRQKELVVELNTVFGVRKYLPKERTLEADIVAYGWLEVLLRLRQEGDYANAKKAIRYLQSGDNAERSVNAAILVESCGIHQALLQKPDKQEKGTIMRQFNTAFITYYGIVQGMERIPNDVKAIISEDAEFIRGFAEKAYRVFGRGDDVETLRHKSNLLKEATYTKSSTVIAAVRKAVHRMFGR